MRFEITKISGNTARAYARAAHLVELEKLSVGSPAITRFAYLEIGLARDRFSVMTIL